LKQFEAKLYSTSGLDTPDLMNVQPMYTQWLPTGLVSLQELEFLRHTRRCPLQDFWCSQCPNSLIDLYTFFQCTILATTNPEDLD